MKKRSKNKTNLRLRIILFILKLYTQVLSSPGKREIR